MKSIVRQIFDESIELGKNIVKETVKVPGDIVMPKQKEQKKEENSMPARQWLEKKAKNQEPSVFEKKNMEEQEKKEAVKKQAAMAAWEQLPKTGSAARRGDPKNIAKQQAGPETSRNLRQD